MSKCLRCGRCCYYLDNFGKKLKCPMLNINTGLIHLNTGMSITSCRLYPDHVGHKIATLPTGVVVCMPREESPKNYPGCPYNKEEKPQ